MPTIDIADAKKDLDLLSTRLQTDSDAFILTHSGQPISVLIGYRKYLGLLEAARLINRRDILDGIVAGMREVKEGTISESHMEWDEEDQQLLDELTPPTKTLT